MNWFSVNKNAVWAETSKKKSLTGKKLQMRMCFNFGHTQPHQKRFNDCFCYYYTTNVIENEIIHLPTAQIPTRMPCAFFSVKSNTRANFYLVHTNHNCGWNPACKGILIYALSVKFWPNFCFMWHISTIMSGNLWIFCCRCQFKKCIHFIDWLITVFTSNIKGCLNHFWHLKIWIKLQFIKLKRFTYQQHPHMKFQHFYSIIQ